MNITHLRLLFSNEFASYKKIYTAFEHANLDAHTKFNRCTQCGRWVCDECFKWSTVFARSVLE
ncbi:MAG: hypothetical protein FWB86_12405 [Treponema sp.]|nr:hypothetical protein [Treponema sp.]MCL2251300.1 hypothetical protein [Treponema sp.]